MSTKGRNMDVNSIRTRRPFWLWAALVVALFLAGAGSAALFVYAGVYNIAADVPHTKPVFWIIDHLRDRSIAVRAQGLTPLADIADAGHVAAGATLYANLCTGCHLAPGMRRTDLSRGLYPKPPQLAYGNELSPNQEFWIVKHGIKLTGMPAWGRTHSDAEVWDIVAFLRKMPTLDPEQYRAMTKTATKAQD